MQSAPVISADAIADAATARWMTCCPTLPRIDDLRLVLRVTLHGLMAPDFDAYHQFLDDRGCTLSSMVTAECRRLRQMNDLGYTDAQWDQLTEIERARAYWNAVDFRMARWKSVNLDQLKAGFGYNTIEAPVAGRIGSLCVYNPPGGVGFRNDCMQDQAPVAFVHIRAEMTRGEVPLIFCFGFDSTVQKWYPYCVILDHFDDGPKCQLRI